MGFLSRIKAFLLFHEIFSLGKFEGSNFKYGNNFSKFWPKTSKEDIFGSIFKNCYFCKILCDYTNSRVLILIKE